MKTYGVCRFTTAAPQTIWRLWSDPNHWSGWNSGVKSAKVDGPLSDGMKGEMTTSRGSVHGVTFHGVVPGRGFSMSMGGPPLTTITFSCEITPDGVGSTVAQNVAFSGPLAFIFGSMMGDEMAKRFVPVLEDLVRTAEART